jgi:hypothetical protein
MPWVTLNPQIHNDDYHHCLAAKQLGNLLILSSLNHAKVSLKVILSSLSMQFVIFNILLYNIHVIPKKTDMIKMMQFSQISAEIGVTYTD